MNNSHLLSYVARPKKYFDKLVPEEDDYFNIKDETHSKYQLLDNIFEKYFDSENISIAKVYKTILNS